MIHDGCHGPTAGHTVSSIPPAATAFAGGIRKPRSAATISSSPAPPVSSLPLPMKARHCAYFP